MIALLNSESVEGGQKDKAGSADHPLIGRFEGSWIGGYNAVEFDEYQLTSGKVNNPGDNTKTLEGKVTKIAYHVPDTISVLQIFRNFQLKMQEAEFEILFECKGRDECGQDFQKTYPILPIPFMWSGSDFRYLASQLKQPDGDVYATLYCETIGGSKKRGCQLSVIEISKMEYKMIDAGEMARSITETGSISLYGIYFDTNKSAIKPESKPTLAEIAKLIKDAPILKLVVVGHTDNQGSLEYNMDLSRRRAEAVADALAKDYGINKNRLAHWGIGYLSPVASNETEAGRAKNRRVALVRQ